MKLTVDASGFERATKALEQTVRRNTEAYGQTLAHTFERQAKTGAPWTDRRGNARGKLYGLSQATGSRVRVEMGGSAPNYKAGPLSASDYLEYLEFAHGKRFATVIPTAEAIAGTVQEDFGPAALEGRTARLSIKRNRKELNQKRKALLTQTQAGWFLLGEQMRYMQWQADHAALNHR